MFIVQQIEEMTQSVKQQADASQNISRLGEGLDIIAKESVNT